MKSRRFDPRLWRKLRQLTQIAALGLFLYLFVYATFLDPQRAWANLFYRFNPLVALTAMLAGRALITGLGLAGITLLVTLLCGRVWCGWICPLGTVLDWLRPRRSPRAAPPEKWRSIKYALLAVLVLAALLGNQTLLFLDPLTLMTRTLATSLWPALKALVYGAETFLYRFDVLWPALDVLRDAVIYPLFRDVDSVFALAAPTALFFAALIALNWWAERFWCRHLCPLGGLLALVSKFALVRRVVGPTCATCALCDNHCPTGTIDPLAGYRSDPAECIVCYDCIVDCTRAGVSFRLVEPAWPPGAREYDPSRRELLAAAGVALAGVALAGAEPITQHEPAHLIRPPGARLTDFETLCIRCGECLRVCPTQGLQPILFESGVQNVLTPHLVPRLGYCNFRCTACGEVCPTGAIPPLSLSQKQTTPIGLARVDRDRCLPWAYNIPCIICQEACPMRHKAIALHVVESVNARGEQVALQVPYVIKELCIGCGICEHLCPMGGEAAIRVYTPTEEGGFLGGERGWGRGQGQHQEQE